MKEAKSLTFRWGWFLKTAKLCWGSQNKDYGIWGLAWPGLCNEAGISAVVLLITMQPWRLGTSLARPL